MTNPSQPQTTSSTSGSVTVAMPPPQPIPRPVMAVGGPTYMSSPTGSPYPANQVGPVWNYSGPTAIIGGTVPAGQSVSQQAAGLASGMSTYIDDVMQGLTAGLQTVTRSASDFSQQLNAFIQPLTQEVWQLGQSVSNIGYLGLAFDSKDKLGFSKITDVGESMSSGAGRASESAQSAADRMEAIASGNPTGAAMSRGAQRYQQLKQQEEDKKKKKKKAQQQSSPSSSGFTRRN